MKPISRICLQAVLLVLVLLPEATYAALPPTTAQLCEAAKNTAAGRQASCLARQDAKQLQGGTANLARCSNALLADFSRAEATAAATGGACPASGDASDVAAAVDAARAQVAQALAGVSGATHTSGALRCEAAKTQAAGKLALCLAKQDAKLAKGRASDPSGCTEKLARDFERAETAAADQGTSCPTTGDSAAIESLLESSRTAIANALRGGRDRLVELFARAFQPLTSEASFSEPATPAYHCLAAASALRRAQSGEIFDPTFETALVQATRASAGWLVSNVGRWEGTAWGLDIAWDAFGDGTTNLVTTAYAFQTGLAIWCLAEAADVLGDESYRALAENALSWYRQVAYTPYGAGYPIDCPSCGYFWYSSHANDVGRFVKNTNVEMAVASLSLDRYRADPAARASGAAAAESQLVEIRDYANYGYLGRHDQAYSPGASAFDDHNSFEAYLLLRAGELLAESAMVSAAEDHFTAYAVQGSTSYVAYAACHFARVLSAAERTCVSWVTSHGATNPTGVGLVMDYR